MKRKAALLGITAVLALGFMQPSLAKDNMDDVWLHIRVVESGVEAEKVSINLPLLLVEQVLPHIKTDDGEFRDGKIRLGRTDMDGADIRAILKAVRDAKDGEYVTVESKDENVRVSKSGGYLMVDVDDDGEKVKVRIPFRVVDAMVSNTEDDELNLMAAVQALASGGEEELVTVEEEDTFVRIWVDRKSSAD